MKKIILLTGLVFALQMLAVSDAKADWNSWLSRYGMPTLKVAAGLGCTALSIYLGKQMEKKFYATIAGLAVPLISITASESNQGHKITCGGNINMLSGHTIAPLLPAAFFFASAYQDLHKKRA